MDLDYLAGPTLITWVFQSRTFSVIREMQQKKQEKCGRWEIRESPTMRSFEVPLVQRLRGPYADTGAGLWE